MSTKFRSANGARGLAVPALLLFLNASAIAADDEIATDRPDIVESPAVVGKGVVQLETSLAFERDKRDGIKTGTRTTPTLLRVGVSDALELRVETDGFTRQSVTSEDESTKQYGFSDLSFGIKWQVGEANAQTAKPATALLFHVDANTGTSAFRSSGAVPSVRMVSEWELPGDASLGVMPGVAWAKNDAGERHWSGILAATYGHPLTESLRGFVEIAGQEIRKSRDGGNVVTFDTGLAWQLDKNTQFDTAINIGLTRQTPDFLITFGFSRRFP